MELHKEHGRHQTNDIYLACKAVSGDFQGKASLASQELIETVRQAYRVAIKSVLAYKVKYKAHKLLHGSMEEHYAKLGRYLQALRDSDTEIFIRLLNDERPRRSATPVFQRLFICFDVVGRDANDKMYPVAWAIVEGENNSSWSWFLSEVQTALNLGQGEGLTIVSDEHLAIISSVASIFPQCEHRHCARHIFAHWHKDFKGDEMKLLFWRAAKAYSIADYTDALDEMDTINPDATKAFKAHNPSVFSARTKHIIYMLEDIRVALMQRLVVKRQEIEASKAQICLRIQARLNEEKAEAANCIAIPSTNTTFQVNHKMDRLNVDLAAQSCTCRKWDLYGIPCCHAVACIFFCRKNAEDFVSEYYTRATYLQSYARSIPQ
ncbi:uncharacterized protein LOC130589845 [Beta vulgaris subsp. vulgaris]|uniref:uncharacterized protein LOC130589845 n=1 Tax=Beta vulgaris subsp. vulgaris TaxID=3555 RepID=UPI002549870A|nr:uncharacterized protein LOC130589845 [Beta vulgaris subsp. vulgaris]